MSLLIDALKKHQHEMGSQISAPEQIRSSSLSNKKKILLISLIIIIVAVLSASTSLLFFKHMAKKEMAKTVEEKLSALQNKGMLAERLGKSDVNPSDSKAAGNPRDALLEKLKAVQSSPANNETKPVNEQTPIIPSSSASTVSETSDSPLSMAGSAANRSTASTSTAVQRPFSSRFQSKRGSGVSANTDTASVSPEQTNSVENEANNVTQPSDISTASASSNDNNQAGQSDNINPVDIQVVSNEEGANNPTYRQALSLMQKNHYDQAIVLLENNDDVLLKTQGLSALLLGRIYLSLNQYDLASDALDHALALRLAAKIDLLSLKAQVLFMQKRYQDVIDLLGSQSPDLISYPEYYTLLADAYMHVGQPSNAVSVFQQIVSQFPNSANYWLGLALAYQKTGDASSALVAYRRAAQLSENDPQVMLFINQQVKALEVV